VTIAREVPGASASIATVVPGDSPRNSAAVRFSGAFRGELGLTIAGPAAGRARGGTGSGIGAGTLRGGTSRTGAGGALRGASGGRMDRFGLAGDGGGAIRGGEGTGCGIGRGGTSGVGARRGTLGVTEMGIVCGGGRGGPASTRGEARVAGKFGVSMGGGGTAVASLREISTSRPATVRARSARRRSRSVRSWRWDSRSLCQVRSARSNPRSATADGVGRLGTSGGGGGGSIRPGSGVPSRT